MPLAQYALAADMLVRFDARLLSHLLSDSGLNATVDDTSAILTAALVDASDKVLSFTLRGGVYTQADLTELYTQGSPILKNMVCSIAAAQLYARRGEEMPSSVADGSRVALQTLKDLRDGKAVFGGASAASIEGNIESGAGDAAIVNLNESTQLRFAADSPFYPSRRTELA